jgi:hypothetical protein
MGEGSTRGRGKLNPKVYKPDALVQVWLDSRKLALLSRWLDQDGQRTRFLSEVVRYTLDMVVEILENEGWKLGEVAESREMLERKYDSTLNPRGRGKKNVLNNIVLESRGGLDAARHKVGGERVIGKDAEKLIKEEDDLAKKQATVTMRLLALGVDTSEFSKADSRAMIRAIETDQVESYIARMAGTKDENTCNMIQAGVESFRAQGNLYEEKEVEPIKEGASQEELDRRYEIKEQQQEQAMKNMMSFRPNVVKTDKP